MKNDAYRFSALSGTFYGLVYIGMIGASIACLVRSPKRNELLSRKHIWPACIASMALCVFEITSIVSQQMVFTGDNRYTPTHRWWGAFRTLFFQYLSPMLIMGLTYVNLIYFMDTTYQVVEESSTKAGIPDFMANSSVNQRQLLMAGTVLFGVVTTMISAFPGCFISFFAFLKPANDPLYSTYHGITNFWEAMFMINAILIGAILIGSAMMVYRSREKYSRTVGLFINQALILCFFELYAWSRLSAVLIDKIGFNQMNATDIDSRGPVVMFCMYLTITVIFISGTLLSNSAMISNRIKDRTDQQIEYKGSASAYGTATASA